jgi:hypothetical protein
MVRETIYVYLGTNGIIESPVHLEDIYYVRKVKLSAGSGKVLTDGTVRRFTVTCAEDEVDNWKEIDISGTN